jgi:hypothetical protein
MQSIYDYIRKEWYIWIGAFVGIMMWCLTNTLVAS